MEVRSSSRTTSLDLAGAGFGIVISYQSANGWLGTLIWALIGAVILGGAFYFDRVLR
jgi:hypothetical protein